MEWLSLIPPALAVGIAIWKREVILALLLALWISETLILGFNPLSGFIATIERVIHITTDADNARILLFSLLIGALLAFIRESGGVNAFVQWITRNGLANTPRRAGTLTALAGVVIFIETNMSILTSGILAQSLFDRFNMSRARLAYIIDSTCAPVCALILLNAWGAYLLGLIQTYGIQDTTRILIATIPLNFYCLGTIALVFYTALSNRVHGPLRTIESAHAKRDAEIPTITGKKRYMLLPLAIMIAGIPVFMWHTGNGQLLQGSGSRSVLWATACAVLCAYILLRFDKRDSHSTLIQTGFKGMSELLLLVTTVLLALALGASLKALGTGEFVAGWVGGFLPLWSIPAVIFIYGSLISFATGTSWGTFALLVPIGMPLAQHLGIPAELLLAAIIGGGVFGDHCSPISDTTIIASLASGCDHIEHVRTQLPYALGAGGISVIAYLLAGIFY